MTPDPSGFATVPSLRGAHVALEPLQADHADGLRAAAADGGLWDLWYTSVPRPEAVEAGWFGRKSGKGFYDYSGEEPLPTR